MSTVNRELHSPILDSPTTASSPTEHGGNSVPNLMIWKSLHNSMQPSTDMATEFCPNSAQAELISERLIRQHLQLLPGFSDKDIQNTSAKICREMDGHRKIFAILVLVGVPARIRHFLSSQPSVSDADLPFTKKEHGPGGAQVYRHGDSVNPLKCFNSLWNRLEINRFLEFQWKFLAPSFSRGAEKPVIDQRFEPEIILPFSWKSLGQGSGGEVFRAEIHPSHHSFGIEMVSIAPLIRPIDSHALEIVLTIF